MQDMYVNISVENDRNILEIPTLLIWLEEIQQKANIYFAFETNFVFGTFFRDFSLTVCSPQFVC